MASPPQGENTGDGDYESVTTEDINIDADEAPIDFGLNDEWTLLKTIGNVFYLRGPAGVYIQFNSGGATEYKQVLRVDGGLSVRSEFKFNTYPANYTPQDVRNVSSPSQGDTAYHDGSGTNTEGLAAYDGTDWISQVDGSTIS